MRATYYIAALFYGCPISVTAALFDVAFSKAGQAQDPGDYLDNILQSTGLFASNTKVIAPGGTFATDAGPSGDQLSTIRNIFLDVTVALPSLYYGIAGYSWYGTDPTQVQGEKDKIASVMKNIQTGATNLKQNANVIPQVNNTIIGLMQMAQTSLQVFASELNIVFPDDASDMNQLASGVKDDLQGAIDAMKSSPAIDGPHETSATSALTTSEPTRVLSTGFNGRPSGTGFSGRPSGTGFGMPFGNGTFTIESQSGRPTIAPTVGASHSSSVVVQISTATVVGVARTSTGIPTGSSTDAIIPSGDKLKSAVDGSAPTSTVSADSSATAIQSTNVVEVFQTIVHAEVTTLAPAVTSVAAHIQSALANVGNLVFASNLGSALGGGLNLPGVSQGGSSAASTPAPIAGSQRRRRYSM